jgi:hypothetical protein
METLRIYETQLVCSEGETGVDQNLTTEASDFCDASSKNVIDFAVPTYTVEGALFHLY